MYFFLVWDLIVNTVEEFYNVLQSVGPFWFSFFRSLLELKDNQL